MPRAVLALLQITGLLAYCSFSLAASQDEAEARMWLDRMSHAARELDYQGTFTYDQGDEMISLSIVHVVRDGVEKERLTHLTGEPREIIRDGHEVTCIHPGSQLIRLDESIPAGPFAKNFGAGLGKLGEHYLLELAGEDRVAGRPTVVINIVARDAYRYGYKLYLDKEHGLLLKSRMVNAADDVLEQFQFASIELDQSIPDEALAPTQKGHVVAHHRLVGGAADAENHAILDSDKHKWRLGWLPGGFMMAAGDIIRAPVNSGSINSMMYSDGLAVFSVFVEKEDGSDRAQEQMQRGGTVIYSSMRQLADESYRVTVVGEVPVYTAEKITRSVLANGDG
jgi:sigma-E factor negative regulatory protein RseB